jgi:glycosyltransferase involved in cell wall biosynthesis
MNCLWLTLADPDPADNGQYLYSIGLIRGLADQGITMHVAGLQRPGSIHAHGDREGSITWHLAEHAPRSRWVALGSRLPNIASRTKTAALRRIVTELYHRRDWDLIVFDSITTGWALAGALRLRGKGRRPVIVHVSHNHEQTVARRQAADEKRSLKKAVKTLEAIKIARLEYDLIRHVDLVTSNTLEDRERFQAPIPKKPVLFLPPGYGGRRVEARTISSSVPRRAIIVGSFDWQPKRLSLEAFLGVADRAFADADVSLDVVGNVPTDFLEHLRRNFPNTRLTGRVPDIVPYMDAARVALVPDQMGGFKLKGLDYVFNRLPIIGIDGSVPGMPLENGRSILLCADHAALVRTVLGVIDDYDRLNDIQNRAFEASLYRFDPPSLARQLLDGVAAVGRGGDPVKAWSTHEFATGV